MGRTRMWKSVYSMLPEKFRGIIQSPGCPSVRPSVIPSVSQFTRCRMSFYYELCTPVHFIYSRLPCASIALYITNYLKKHGMCFVNKKTNRSIFFGAKETFFYFSFHLFLQFLHYQRHYFESSLCVFQNASTGAELPVNFWLCIIFSNLYTFNFCRQNYFFFKQNFFLKRRIYFENKT